MELQYCARIHGLGMYQWEILDILEILVFRSGQTRKTGNSRHSGNSRFPFWANQENRKFWTFFKSSELNISMNK
jgi:hypothetical protein